MALKWIVVAAIAIMHLVPGPGILMYALFPNVLVFGASFTTTFF